MASSTNTYKSREAYKAAKELEEARKAGTAPPAVDSDGKIINPHIPEYIAQAPWYLQQEGPSLKHQRSQAAKKRKYDTLGKWLPRGQFQGPAATRYRKGACENCGAMTHTAKTCLERPRRRGAKLTGRGIRADEVVGNVELDFQGKRDRWNGYDEAEYDRVHQRYAKLEHARKAVKAERLDNELRDGKPAAASDSDDDEREGDGAVVQQTGEAAKMSVRNLRIREDTAKYLYNLDVNSAYYDPKSRAMRADPRPDVNAEDKDFTGDNFVRFTGDVKKLAQMELHALRANDVGRRLPHLQAEPSRAEALFKDFEAKQKGLQEKRQADIMQKYGGEEYMKPEAGSEGVRQSEVYVEYNSEGKIVSGAREAIPVSKYPEDILEKNHTAIWGSFFKDGKWGYACCHQLQRYAYCTGEAGKKAAEETEKEMEKRVSGAMAKRNPKSLVEQWKENEGERKAKEKPTPQAAEAEKKKQIEIEKEMRRQQREENAAAENDRRRGYGSVRTSDGTREMSDTVMEAYRLRKQMKDDPMAKFLAKGER